MNFPGVINLSQAAAARVDAFTGAIIRLAAALERSNDLRDVEQNGPRG